MFPALTALGLAPDAVRRANAAVCSGHWRTEHLLVRWQQAVTQQGYFAPNTYEGIRPVACDLTAFFRPQLQGLTSKHYLSEAGKSLPAVVFGLCVTVGHVSCSPVRKRLGLLRLLVRQQDGESEATLQKRLVAEAATTLAQDEALIVDAGFPLADLLVVENARFVARIRRNQSARRNTLPAYSGRGRRPERGKLIRPLPRTRAGNTISATPPDTESGWQDGPHRLWAQEWNALVLPDAKIQTKLEAASFRIVAVFDERYPEPLLLATTLSVSAEALWRLYRDRWAVEQLPLSAKPMLGTERSFVSGNQSRVRLPELALLSGNLLSYVAATHLPMASGFWDRAARPTCGRLRRALSQKHCWEFPVDKGQLRKKNSVTAHLKTGVEAHRRTKPIPTLSEAAQAA